MQQTEMELEALTDQYKNLTSSEALITLMDDTQEDEE